MDADGSFIEPAVCNEASEEVYSITSRVSTMLITLRKRGLSSGTGLAASTKPTASAIVHQQVHQPSLLLSVRDAMASISASSSLAYGARQTHRQDEIALLLAATGLGKKLSAPVRRVVDRQATSNASVVPVSDANATTQWGDAPLPVPRFALEARALLSVQAASAAEVAVNTYRVALAAALTAMAASSSSSIDDTNKPQRGSTNDSNADMDVEAITTARFAPLTVEDAALVHDAVYDTRQPEDEVLMKQWSIPMRRRDMRTLGARCWVNDEVANFVLECIRERHTRRIAARVAAIAAAQATGASAPPLPLRAIYIANTFFYSKLTEDSKDNGRVVDSAYCYANVRRWTTRAKVNVFACELALIPINFSNTHWALAKVSFDERKIYVYDSLGSGASAERVYSTLHRWLRDEFVDKMPLGYDLCIDSWVHARPQNSPRQKNGYDCGVFMLVNADFLSCGQEPDFKQEHMGHFRSHLARVCMRQRIE